MRGRLTLAGSAGARFALMAAALAFGSGAMGAGDRPPEAARYPDRAYLESSWQSYKRLYLHRDGYVYDPTREEVTSEGQSYLLLRAVWMGDLPAFELAFGWTEKHLRRREDSLYAWQWHPGEGGRVLDWNTATDADQDIAFALILAGHRFGRPAFTERARELLADIRLHTGIDIEGGWFPSAGNWAVRERVVNLSYFLPYAYPYFDRADPDGRWMRALETGYALLERTMARPGARLPPDFMTVAEDGAIGPVRDTERLSERFSFDAMRIYWRVAMDCRLHARPAACADPARTREVVDLLARDGVVFSRYALDGEALTDEQSWSFYGSLLPAFDAFAPEAARLLRERKLTRRQLDSIQRKRNRYYDLNWLWFGVAGAEGLIAERTPAPAAIFGP